MCNSWWQWYSFWLPSQRNRLDSVDFSHHRKMSVLWGHLMPGMSPVCCDCLKDFEFGVFLGVSFNWNKLYRFFSLSDGCFCFWLLTKVIKGFFRYELADMIHLYHLVLVHPAYVCNSVVLLSCEICTLCKSYTMFMKLLFFFFYSFHHISPFESLETSRAFSFSSAINADYSCLLDECFLMLQKTW